MLRTSTVAASVAHLIGPGKLKVLNGRLAFSAPDNRPLRLDARALKSLFCYGRVSVSDEAMRVLLAGGIAVAWMSPCGARCRGRLVTDRDSSTTLRMMQHGVLRRGTPHAAGQGDGR